MQTLAIVSKVTKAGVSVWHFVKTDTGYYAFGGIDPKCKQFNTIEELRSCYANWVRYGYAPGIVSQPKVKHPVTRKTQALVADPWESKLPLSMQLELDALSA